MGSLTSPADHNREDAGDGTYGLSSLSEKTRMSNHLQMSSQRQHILLSYFKTLSVGPVWARTRDLPHRSPALYELTGRRLAQWILFQLISVEGSSEMKPALRFFFQSLPSGCLSYKKFNFEIKVRGPPTRLGAPARNNFLRLLFTWSIFVLQKESHCSVQTLKKKNGKSP